MDHLISFQLQNCIDDLDTLFSETATFADAVELASDARFALEVCLEEMVTNVIKYAHDDGCSHSISIHLARRGDEMEIIVEDDGAAFDPTSRPDVDTSLPLDERPIGGLGLHMVKKMMDSLQYERTDGKNKLVMKRDLAKIRLRSDKEE